MSDAVRRSGLYAAGVTIAFLSLATSGILLAGEPREAFYGVVPKLDSSRIDRIRSLLSRIDTDCPEASQRCPVTDELLLELYGNLDNRELPILFVYLDENLRVRANRLVWRKRVTPFIYGVQHLSVVLLSEQPVNLEAKLTTIWSRMRRIVGGTRDLFVSSGRRLKEEREARSVVTPLTLQRLAAGEDDGAALWLAHEQFYLEEETAYQIGIGPADEKAREAVDFHQVQARFTNSKEQRVDFGVGIGYSFDVRSEIASEAEGIATGSGLITANWLFNIYLRRPLLIDPIKPRLGSRYRVSLAATVGVNLNVFELEQLILGLNVGHLFGRHGLLVGVNFINPRGSSSTETEAVPYAALAFTF